MADGIPDACRCLRRIVEAVESCFNSLIKAAVSSDTYRIYTVPFTR